MTYMTKYFIEFVTIFIPTNTREVEQADIII